ncbi:lysophospholipid acyltransferase family protein, partial [Acinetobacter baumannii]
MEQHFPNLPSQVPQRGNALSRALFKKLFLAQGWTIEGEVPNFPKAVAIISPHTSNIDGWYGFLAIFGLGIQITVLGKDSLFKPPFKRVLDWAGVIPVKRDSANGLTEQVVATIQQYDKIWIGMAPEGTRKKAKKMKSGFYHIAAKANIPIVMFSFDIAAKANIPIVMFSFDYDRKTIHCLGYLTPSGNYDEDLAKIF